MKSILLSAIFSMLFSVSIAQQFILETGLDTALSETSGLLYINNTLITHNDTASTNQLFDVDTETGAVTRTVTITNASNTDWEDLTHDDTYIYIGDFGNYQGDRTNLKVYRITIADYFASNSITAEIINFSYSNQTDFTTSPLATNFDAEGLIHYNNTLYVFSKNWLDGNTNIYELPKTPGTHSISLVDTITAQGLVSGATYNPLDGSIFLTGYDSNGAFLIQLSGYSSGLFSNGSVVKTSIAVPTNYSPQIEGIIPINATEYYVSAEEISGNASGLYSFNTSTLSISDVDIKDVSFYPNPAKGLITINRNGFETKIYSTLGELVMISSKKEIDISNLAPNIYLVKIESNTTDYYTIKRLIIK
ncbi:T9SS type A sorting domain-containing protein [Winogradskyella luteola]|uniref:T9SS type A sorting domain-containing protein n=1 Tax=Winogradskyella luteola TaxID=2828330 RepID=A0A9X1JNW4_9FLAO|nr:T9SS type A sorting domain-containing protein [Winogradskyella luteola]MBV7268089.1 T9SS type A sorting domain-containing protein [Winogradskyella luteola]